MIPTSTEDKLYHEIPLSVGDWREGQNKNKVSKRCSCTLYNDIAGPGVNYEAVSCKYTQLTQS